MSTAHGLIILARYEYREMDGGKKKQKRQKELIYYIFILYKEFMCKKLLADDCGKEKIDVAAPIYNPYTVLHDTVNAGNK